MSSAPEDYAATIQTLREIVAELRTLARDSGERQSIARDAFQLCGETQEAIKAFHAADGPERVEQAGELIQIKIDLLEFL